MKSNQLKMAVSFNLNSFDKKNEMEFYVSTYTLNGTYLGFFPVNNQLSLCSRVGQDISDFRKFGVTFQTKFFFYFIERCAVDLRNLIKNKNTLFYELYLKDIDGKYVPIPILVRNLRNRFKIQ